MKFIKRFSIGLLILIILSTGTIFVLVTYYKKELTTLLTEHLKSNYGLTLNVSDVDVVFFDNWPNGSIKLKDVFVASDLNGPGEPILTARTLSLSFDIKKMLHKEFIVQYISISDAEVMLVKGADGKRNFEFKKQSHDTSKHTGIKFEINRIAIQNVKFKFLNNEKGQVISMNFEDITIRLKQYLYGTEATLRGKTVVDGLMFNPQKGDFLKNATAKLDLNLNYIYGTKIICIYPPSSIEINDQQYDINSLIALGENKKLALNIEGKKVNFEKTSALLTPKIKQVLSNFDVKQPIDAKILLVVNLGIREEPIILAEVSGENCDLTIGNSKIPYSKLNFRGKIRSLDSTRQRGNMDEATLVFDPIRGNIYDFPFTASVHVKNLIQPDITIDAHMLIEAKKIPFDVSKDFILKGSAMANVKYTGPTDKLNKDEFLKSPMKLTANVTFRNFSYKELERPYVYTVNGVASLDNNDLHFENLHVKTNIAEALVKGNAEGFVPYLFGRAKGFKATIAASTENLDLNPLIGNSDPTAAEPTSEPQKDKAKKIDQSHFEFTVNLSAKHLVFRKIEASNANVDLFYRENSLNIKSVSVNTCDGIIAGKAMIENFNKVDADISVENVNVKKLFEEFDNFGQQAIVGDNLKGNIFVEAKFKTDLDQSMKLKPETMVSDVKLKLIDGHLINFEPVQNLSNFLFKNRDFNDVTFAQLDESFKLRGYEMQIDELEIGSNVLNLFVVDGLYNFKGNSTINILIPWSNLKKRGKNYIPKNSGESAENTKGLKLNFSGPSNKMKISLGHKTNQ